MQRTQISQRLTREAAVRIIVSLLLLFTAITAHAENIVYPAGANVINVKTPPYNAKGNGTDDDTPALQAAIIDGMASRRLVYIPNGTYLVSDTLKANDPSNSYNEGWNCWLNIQGQSRAGAIIKLKSNCPGFTVATVLKSVVKYGSTDGQNVYTNGEGNQAFGNYLRNVTVDTGAGNLGAVGVDFQGSNFAAIRDVTIKSTDATRRGKVGLYLEGRDNGPAMVKNVSVDGFDYGVTMRQEIAHFTFEFLTLTNQKVAGFYVDGMAIIRKLTSTNTVPAIEVHGNGNLNLLDGTLGGGAAGTSAVVFVDGESRGLLRDVTASGYARVVTNRGTNVAGTSLGDWTSDAVNSKFPSPPVTLRLPVEETPTYWNATLSNWANVVDYGATPNDSSNDDAVGIQAALNSGKPVIYLPAGFYHINATITVPATVRHILGIGIAELQPKGAYLSPMLSFTGGNATQTTVVEQLLGGGADSRIIGHDDARTLAITDFGTFGQSAAYNNSVAGAKLFFDDASWGGYTFSQPIRVWARQWNIEGSAVPKASLNNQAKVWALGVKAEGATTIFGVKAGSALELYGGFNYTFGVDNAMPLLSNAEGALTASFVTQSYVNGPFDLLVKDTRNGATQEFRRAEALGRSGGSVSVLYTSYPAVNPSADAFVRDGSNANTNYGTQGVLTVKKDSATNSGNNRWVYLKFDASTLAGAVGKATLRLYGKYNNGSGSANFSVYAVPDTSWTETGINWNNKPALGAKQGGSVTITPTTQYYDFDVTAYVLSERAAGRNTIAFAVTGDAVTSPTTNLNSREASKGQPLLLITNPSAVRPNAGGGADSGFDDDNTNVPDGNTGTYYTSDPIDVSGVSSPAPQQERPSANGPLIVSRLESATGNAALEFARAARTMELLRNPLPCSPVLFAEANEEAGGMKAIRIHEFGGPEVLQFEDVPDPAAGLGQVLIRVHAVGVNPVDTYIRSGIYGPRTFPLILGMDAAGVVESVGEGVTTFQPGDRVYTSTTVTGAYAEKTLADAAAVRRLPDKVSFSQGAGVNTPYATAYRALLHKAQGRAGETVLVHGASGGVGIAALQIGRAYGFRVFGTAGTDEGLALIQREGAQFAFNHGDDGYLDAAKAQTPDGKGFDIILEMLANVNLAKDLMALAPFGRVVVIGNRGTIEINPRDAMRMDAAILGMTLFNIPPPELDSIHAALYAGLENGTLRPVVGKELPLSDAAQAHIDVMKSSGAHGKIVLLP